MQLWTGLYKTTMIVDEIAAVRGMLLRLTLFTLAKSLYYVQQSKVKT
jgi:hypothetical protein